MALRSRESTGWAQEARHQTGGNGGGEWSLFGKLINRRLPSERLPPPGGSCGRLLEGEKQVTKMPPAGLGAFPSTPQ